uniref:Ovule protein n=1 Tax=Ascaris lumbricoides TaxID=6252 RepID=A0A0M3IW14_ASCLU
MEYIFLKSPNNCSFFHLGWSLFCRLAALAVLFVCVSFLLQKKKPLICVMIKIDIAHFMIPAVWM